MNCPLCSATIEPPPAVYNLTICPACLRTLTANGAVATGAQTTVLPPEAIAQLRQMQATARKAMNG